MDNFFLLKNAINTIYQIDNECMKSVERITEKKIINKNDFYSRKDDYVKDMSFVISGILRMFHIDKNGNEWNIHFLKNDDFLFANCDPKSPSTTYIQALTPVYLLSIPYPKMMELVSQNDSLKTFFSKLTYQIFDKKQEREIQLLSTDAEDKYLAFLKKFSLLESQISHYHIASYLGITPTQLSRIRKKMNAR